MSPRLATALAEGGLRLPEGGEIAVLHPRAGMDLGPLERSRVTVVQPFRPDHAYYQQAGYPCEVALPAKDFAAIIICVPRAKALAQALIGQAATQVTGPLIVDGAKTDGVDSLLRAVRKRAPVDGSLAKAHGKLFWFTPRPQDWQDWAAPTPSQIEGFVTQAGLFSANRIDPASRLLAQSLPQKLGGHLADLGAGWGYLSAQILTRSEVKSLAVVEADAGALACARQNLSDARAGFHWADARLWRPTSKLDGVVMNPPFHTDRRATPELGQAFIRSAAHILAPAGQLWLVANRHLPYETSLRAQFAQVAEIAGDGGFKVLHAARPKQP